MWTGNYVGNRIRKCCKSDSNSMALRLNISACAKFSNTPLPNLFIIDYIGAGLPVCLTNGRQEVYLGKTINLCCDCL